MNSFGGLRARGIHSELDLPTDRGGPQRYWKERGDYHATSKASPIPGKEQLKSRNQVLQLLNHLFYCPWHNFYAPSEHLQNTWNHLHAYKMNHSIYRQRKNTYCLFLLINSYQSYQSIIISTLVFVSNLRIARIIPTVALRLPGLLATNFQT